MSAILIVEDEEAMLDIFSEVITDMGHQAIRARDGEEALLLARTHAPQLVISDFMMPRRTGLDLLRALRADSQLNAVPFVLLSAALPKERNEANLFLSKPIDLDAFEGVINEALQKWPVATPPKPPEGAKREPTARDNGALRDDMLNWVAHELKTPLSSARLNAQIMVRKLEQQDLDSAHRYATSVVKQVDRMDGLVTSILDAARLNDGKVVLRPAPTELVAFLNDLIRDWRDLQPSVDFSLSSEVSRLDLSVDAERIRHVLNNLLSNAVKYGGTARRVELSLSVMPGMVSVAVRDWGIGIPAADVPNVFERFHRIDTAEGRGHGLGLFIAAALARLHGGSLSVKSTLGEGSTFTLRLPLGRPALQSA